MILVKHGVTPDDRHCQGVSVARVPGLTEARVIISEAA